MVESKLLDALIQNKVITSEQATQLKVEASQTGKSIEILLIEKQLVNETKLTKTKASLFNIPFINIQTLNIPDKIMELIPMDTMRKYKLLPFKEDGVVLNVAMADPFDIQAIQYIKHKLPQFTQIKTWIAPRSQILSILENKSSELISEEISESLEEVDTVTTKIDDVEENIGDQASLSQAPVTKIVNTIIGYAVNSGASDIHIEPTGKKVRVRYRIHGVLVEKVSLPKGIHPAIVARIKIMSKLKIDVKNTPQDGHISIKYKNKSLDLRVSTLPSIHGEKVVIRVLEKGGRIPPLEESGMRGISFSTYIESIKATTGIILITGPTGSGKTRTLASTITRINNVQVNIVTVEDPVEIRIPGVIQVQVNPRTGLTFANALRAILRQDPDIIMVGEIRDAETAELAVRAALTGHLVLATLHTNSATAALPRLVDMGIEPYLLASTIKSVGAQRLVRTICPYCIEAVPIEPEIEEDINKVLGNIEGFNVIEYLEAKCQKGNVPSFYKCPEEVNGKKVGYMYKGKGCPKCDGSGYNGRTGIFEVLRMTESIGRLVMKNKPTSEIQDEAIKNGMMTMMQDGYLKVLDGITTIEEVLRVIHV